MTSINGLRNDPAIRTSFRKKCCQRFSEFQIHLDQASIYLMIELGHSSLNYCFRVSTLTKWGWKVGAISESCDFAERNGEAGSDTTEAGHAERRGGAVGAGKAAPARDVEMSC